MFYATAFELFYILYSSSIILVVFVLLDVITHINMSSYIYL